MNEEVYKEIKRTFLKHIVLKIIRSKPTHGYDIIKKVELLSKGRWTPSAGSIYPILVSLESKNFIRSEEIDRKKVYSITPEGIAALDRMTKEKLEILKEMSRLINIVIESSDNSDAGCDADCIQDEEQQPEATHETEDGKSPKFEKI
jgi:DNA-binding PadR family transcriptional regulator